MNGYEVHGDRIDLEIVDNSIYVCTKGDAATEVVCVCLGDADIHLLYETLKEFLQL